MARPLTPLGQQMLAALPRALRQSNDYQAVIHAASREVALLEASVETVRAQFVPATADVLLNAWEAQLHLPVGGPLGSSIADRQALVTARLRKVLSGGLGLAWEQAVTEIVGTGWSYIEGGAPQTIGNQVPNPSGEHDATGAAPAGWLAPTGPGVTTVWQTQAGWSAVGVKAFRLTATGVPVGGQQTAPIAPLSCAPGQWVSARATYQLIAHRSTIRLDFLNGSGGVISSTWPTGAVSGKLELLDARAPAGTVTVRLSCGFFNEGGSTGTVDGYFDAVQLLVSDQRSALGVYGDGDSAGWVWLGTVGNSPSGPQVPAAGVIQIALPFASGTSDFAQATQQIRDLTDAHLELEFVASGAFRLDSSQMDVQPFA